MCHVCLHLRLLLPNRHSQSQLVGAPDLQKSLKTGVNLLWPEAKSSVSSEKFLLLILKDYKSFKDFEGWFPCFKDRIWLKKAEAQWPPKLWMETPSSVSSTGQKPKAVSSSSPQPSAWKGTLLAVILKKNNRVSILEYMEMLCWLWLNFLDMHK